MKTLTRFCQVDNTSEKRYSLYGASNVKERFYGMFRCDQRRIYNNFEELYGNLF